MNAVLPKYYHRKAWLRAFWLTALGALGSAGTLALGGLGAGGVVWGVALTSWGLALGIGWQRPGLVSLPYKVVRKAQMLFGGWARRYVAGLCYLLVIVPAGWLTTGSRPTAPTWVSRGAPESANAAQHLGRRGDGGALKSPYRQWAAESKYPLAGALTPFLVVLGLLQDGTPEIEVPAETYTLY